MHPIFVSVTVYAKKSGKPTKAKPGKAGVDFIFAEGRRAPWASQHVAEIQAPTLVWNLPIDDIQRLHDDRLNRAFTMTTGRVRRKIRCDQCTLLVVVASYKGAPATILSDPALRADYDEWEQRVLAFLRKKFGDELVGVVRHTDEANLHVHAFVVPSDFEMRARALHPGHAAADRAMAMALADGETKKTASDAGRVAYKKAMTAFLNDYHVQVGLPCGHTRHGAKNTRRTRADIMTERRAAEGIMRAERLKLEIVAESRRRGLEQAQAEAERQQQGLLAAAQRQVEEIKAEAECQAAEMFEHAKQAGAEAAHELRGAARKEMAAANADRRAAAKELAAAEHERATAAKLGSRVGKFFAGVTGAVGQMRNELKEQQQRERERAMDRVAVLQEDKAEPQRQMQAAERKLLEARESANLARAELERFQALNDSVVADDPENTKTQKI